MGSCGESSMVDDVISGGSVIEQHSCSEIPVQCDPVQQSCSEGVCNVLDSDVELCGVKGGCVDFPCKGQVGSSAGVVDVTDRCQVDSASNVTNVCGDGLASECEDADVLLLEKTFEDNCQNPLGMCCGSTEVSGINTGGLCLEGKCQDEGNLDTLSESPAVNGLQEYCVQQGEQKDDTTNVCPSVGDDSAVVGGKDHDAGLLPDASNCVPDFRHSEMSLESEPMTDSQVDCNQQNEQGDIMRDADPLSKVVEKCDAFSGMEANACRNMYPSQAMEMAVPSSALYTEVESRSDQLCDLKTSEDWNNTFEEKTVAFVGEESIIDSFVPVLSSPCCGRTLGNSPVVDSSSEPSLLDQGNEVKNDILQVEENLCQLKECHSEDATNCASTKSFGPGSGQSSVVLIANDSSKDVPDLPPKSDAVSVNNSIVVDTAGQTYNDGKDIVEADCFTESILLPSQRNSRRTKVGRKTQTKRASRKCKNKDGVMHAGGGMKINLEVARRKRSRFSKPARSSLWGLLGNIERFFGQDNELGVSKAVCQELGKTRSKRQSGKAIKNIANSSSLSSVQKYPVPTTRVRLKIKFGKEIDLSSSNVSIPETVDGLASAFDLGTGSGFEKVASNAEDRLSEVVALGNLESSKNNLEKDALVLNGQITISHIESTAISEKSGVVAEAQCLLVPPERVVEPVIEPINNKDMDPGTSPDSEVINSLPEVQVVERHQEDVHHATLGPSSEFNSNLDVIVNKRGKKKDKLTCSSNCITEDGSHGPRRNNRAKHSKNHRRKKNFSDAVSSLELPTSTEINASSKSISSKELSTEPLPHSGEIELGDSTKDLKVQSHIEVEATCKPVDHRLSESQGSENLLCSARSLGRKLPKSLTTSKVSKARSKSSDSTSRTTCRSKERQKKPTNKSGVKGKGLSRRVKCEVEDHRHPVASIVGNHKLDPVRKMNAGNNKISVNVANLDMAPGIDLGEKHLSLRNAWVRCDDCHKWRRIPALLADQIDETNCTWTCKDSNDNAFADCAIPQEKSNAEINAELGLSEASGEEDAYEGSKNYKELEYQLPLVSQESTFTRILTNEFMHRSPKTQTIDEIMVCHCKLPQEGKVGCGDECLNRMLNIECVQGTCPCGDHCSNQQFQKRKYANLRWFKCGKKGYGLKALDDIAKGQFLIEYVGEVLDMHAYEARQREYALKGHRHFYFMTLNGSEVIDASAKGNLGRFINHSCDPNCRTEKWMVNGEICIGLFALRDIKQDEEVTFDYNYVRVFGAAAKKCYCGSLNCRGYIGVGDPLNDDLIVQGDSDEEFPEPVMLTDDGEIEDSVPIPKYIDNVDRLSARHLLKDRDVSDKPTIAIDSGGTLEKESSMKRASAVSMLQSSEDDSKGKLPSVQVEEIFQQVEDAPSKTVAAVQEGYAMESDLTDKSSSIQRGEMTSLHATVGEVFLNSTYSNRESKSEIVEGRHDFSQSHLPIKTPQLIGSVKKGKVRPNLPNGLKIEATVNRLPVSSGKLKKVVEGSSNGRFEAVQEKLSELLDGDGGISKRKDATKGYLKLLLLTVASGDRSNGEAIQSNRDLSMILDALLKTKSRAVLNDIINKNGLQMLHKIMKQYRQDFKKIPILRKLLKVLEYLAASKILTLEHINGGPPCHGMESFRESMLSLTEHDDKQVHQIARSFRDRWIPRPVRKHGYMDRDDNRVESHRIFNCNRYSSSHNHRHEQDLRPTEAIDCVQQSVRVTTSVEAATPERCSALSLDGVEIKRERKRKSRWDQPGEINSFSHAVIGSITESQNIHEDVPPGFSCPVGSVNAPFKSGDHALQNASRSGFTSDLVVGHPKEKFNSRVPVSYGMPWSVVKQYGTPHAEIVGSWVTAPGMPFNPFPPLPPYLRDEKACQSSNSTNAMVIDQPAEVKQWDTGGLVNCCSDDMSRSAARVNPEDLNLACEDNKNTPKRLKDDSYDLGRRYFRQQKWNNSKIERPWFRRSAWKCNGNDPSGDMCSIGVGNVPKESEVTCSEDAICRDEKGGNNI